MKPRESTGCGRPEHSFLPLLLLVLGMGRVIAQTPGGIPQVPQGPTGSVSPPLPPPALAKPPRDMAASEVLLFRIRSAFSLTPVMVASLQARGSDSGSGPASAAASAAASGAAASSAAKSESSVQDKAAQDRGAPIGWSDALVREVPFSVSLDVRLVGKNVLAIMQLTPIETGGQEINLLAQGQVWVQKPDGTLSFNTSFQSLNIALGSRLYFYPLGVDARNGAPIAVEIKVDRSALK